MSKKYSGKKVIKAGEKLRDPYLHEQDPDCFSESADIMSYWRFSHESSLEQAFILVQKLSLKHDKNAIFAKRLKRMVSIVRKLRRFERMQLKNMHDIGGCRAILSNEKRLRKVVRELKKYPEFQVGKGYRIDDYIQKPKEDGYRSFHLVGKFKDNDGQIKSIEVQLRTQIQHYWATAVEIVDLFTGQALKSSIGNQDWKDFFLSVSQQFAIMEGIHLFETLPPQEKLRKYNKEILSNPNRYFEACINAKKHSFALKVIDRLNAFSGSLKVIDTKLTGLKSTEYGYVLLEIDIPNLNLSTRFFPNEESEDAEAAYLASEKEAAEKESLVVALVSTSAVGDIKKAYPNYFADSSKFLSYVDIIQKTSLPKEKNLFERMFSTEKLGDLR